MTSIFSLTAHVQFFLAAFIASVTLLLHGCDDSFPSNKDFLGSHETKAPTAAPTQSPTPAPTEVGKPTIRATEGTVTAPFVARIGYVELPGPADKGCGNGTCGGQIAFNIHCASSADVSFKADVLAIDGKSNSFYLQIGAEVQTWHTGHLTRWGWSSTSQNFSVPMGYNELVLKGREDGIKIKGLTLVDGRESCFFVGANPGNEEHEGAPAGKISDLFTFGAPGAIKHPSSFLFPQPVGNSPSNEKACFGGFRMYRSIYSFGHTSLDIVPSIMNSLYSHMKQNVLVAGASIADSSFHWCSEEDDELASWPKPCHLPGCSLSSALHAVNSYSNRSQDMRDMLGSSVDGYFKRSGDCHDYFEAKGCSWTADHSCPGQADGYRGVATSDNSTGYECCCTQEMWQLMKGLEGTNARKALSMLRTGAIAAGISDLIMFMPSKKEDAKEQNNWPLMRAEAAQWMKELDAKYQYGITSQGYRAIAAAQVLDDNFFFNVREDNDWLLLYQHESSLDCILAFEGTDRNQEWLEHVQVDAVDFCGCHRCAHHGWVKEVQVTLESEFYETNIKTRLPYCRNVMVTGTSLGGAIADLYTYCVNSGSGKDYALASWVEQEPRLMDPW